jgi:hypothetical protein
MSNFKGNQNNLTSYQSDWYSQPTKTIRVPVGLADAILDWAHRLDFALSQVKESEGVEPYLSLSGAFGGVEDDLPP